MATKNDPGQFDCYAKALPDEPMFVLLARDPDFASVIQEWADRRAAAIRSGLRPETDWPMVAEAQACATAGEKWRKDNNGKWRAINMLIEAIAKRFEEHPTFDIWRSDAASMVRSFKHDLSSAP